MTTRRGKEVETQKGRRREAAKHDPVDPVGATWSPEALAFFASVPDPELGDFEISQDELPETERDLF